MSDQNIPDNPHDTLLLPETPGQGSERAETLPEKIGRYRVRRLLGTGGFGRVYLAHDDDLDRPVAIKVPNPERISRPEDIEAYLTEARTLARLDHPHIVPVHDVGRSDDGLCYVVSKFIEGSDLADRIKQTAFSHRDAAGLVAVVADALHYAHSRHLVHRDVKPANILIDARGKAYVADFGLALKDEDFGKGPGFAGTPAYMSPEQAGGEGHRVDGRSDIFSLGVVFYELLSGQRPFRGATVQEVLDRIRESDSRPPRQFVDTIPKELERICLKALTKRATERYTTARDMAEDLLVFLRSPDGQNSPTVTAAPAAPTPQPGSTVEATPVPPTSGRSDSDVRPIKVVPKGLRSFDEHDADFFLELLPGARDRDGLPEGLRFWKTRIEPTDPDRTFRVGLIYGPSGCGKSSMVKAGLIPRLAKHVHTVYIEATPEETEPRLLRGLRKACPDIPTSLGLVDSVASVRRDRFLGNGRKVLLVLDQFEQWLFARRNEQATELVAALRQCDGEHVQAVVMVRDDFWLAASRFMRDLEIDLVPDRNIALVDLFEQRHARKVLRAFGQAYGAIGEAGGGGDKEQTAFLDRAVEGLSQEGKVISVRLALFAEMLRGKPWMLATLKEVGGTEGVGVAFLEETFVANQANPKHRLHQKAAQAVLKALLPETGTDIKGEMRSEAELRDASGYASRPRDFDDLIHVLDAELRLITPTDPEGSTEDAQASKPAGGRYYQFTHDYLVPSLREWLTRKQRETRRGRAELKLAERSATWNARPENRHLPSVGEWATIKLLTRRKDRTGPQQKMMRRAEKVHGKRALGLVILVALGTWAGIEGYGNVRAAALVESLKTASTADVPPIIDQISGYRRWADPRLKRLLRSSKSGDRDHLHASLALLSVDASQVDHLYGRLIAASPSEFPVLRDLLRPHQARLVPKLWTMPGSAKSEEVGLLPTASALALYDPENPRWAEVGGKVAQSIVTVNPVYLGPWLDALRPVKSKLTAPLAAIFRDKGRPETEHTLATNILADYASADPALLADLLMDAEPKSYAALFPIARRQAVKTSHLFRAEVRKKANPGGNETDPEQVKDRLAERQARAAVALVRLGHADEVWPLLKHSADPRLRSFIVNWLTPLGADPKSVVAGLDGIDPNTRPAAAPGQQVMDAVLFHPETSMRRALILALGTYGAGGLSPGERGPLTVKLLDLYRNDPDAGVHGAAEWTLRQWDQREKLKAADSEMMTLKDRGDRRWYVNGQGQTFAVIEGPVEFRMGSPETEPDHSSPEALHRRRVNRRYALAAKEVTVEQYQRFRKLEIDKYSPDPDGPMNGPSWYDAAAYCNWLSEREGLDKAQWCYEPNSEGDYAEGMKVVPSVLERTGYRLPTEAEWEYACRAGAATGRYYGSTPELLGKYAWYTENSKLRAWPCGQVKPNDLGLFDMLGNVYEWCQDQYGSYPPARETGFVEDVSDASFINEKNPRLLRGGAFSFLSAFVRSAYRNWVAPSYGYFLYGFRPSRTYP